MKWLGFRLWAMGCWLSEQGLMLAKSVGLGLVTNPQPLTPDPYSNTRY